MQVRERRQAQVPHYADPLEVAEVAAVVEAEVEVEEEVAVEEEEEGVEEDLAHRGGLFTPEALTLPRLSKRPFALPVRP